MNDSFSKMQNRIYFFIPSYATGGGDLFIFRLIDYLIVKENKKIGIIDYSDGILTRTGKKFFPNDDINYIPYETMDWDLEDDSCIFVPGDRIGYVKNIKAKNVKILCYHWATDIDWSTLFKKNTFYKLGKLLNENNACAFVDYGCWLGICHAFKQRFEKKYIPLFFYNENTLPNEEQNKRQAEILEQIQSLNEELRKISRSSDEQNNRKDEINVVWLGRITGPKTLAIKNFIKNFSSYSTNKKKNFHIIGNGLDEETLKEYCKDFTDINFIFKGLMLGKERDVYLQEHTDVGFAMGTALLNFAALYLPVIAAQEAIDLSYQDKFCWFFDCYEYCLGSPREKDCDKEDFKPLFKNIQPFNKMLDAISIFNKHEEYGKKCFKYYNEHYNNIKFTVKCLLSSINSTCLTYEKLKKCLKYLPYGSSKGLFIRRYYLLWMPIVKTVTNFDKTYFYIFGIKIGMLQDNYKIKHLKIFGFSVFKYNIYGKYDFASICSEQIKKQCINSYSINKRIFGDKK